MESAWTAVAVALESTGVLASQGLVGSARYVGKAPLAHCWPLSQATAWFAGLTPAANWPSIAIDWRHTPS